MNSNRQKKLKSIIGLSVSVIFLVLIFYNIDFHELSQTFKGFDCSKLHVIVTFYAFSLLCRAVRWKFLLKSDPKYSLYQLGSSWVIGNFMNAFLPARAGDIWRAFAVGSTVRESKMKIFGSIMLERILDGVCVCVFLYACIIVYSNLLWIRQLANFSMMLFGGSLVVFWYLIKFNKINGICTNIMRFSSVAPLKIRNFIEKTIKKLCGFFTSFVNGFEVIGSGYYSAMSLIFSFATWALECLMAYYIIVSFGINCGFAAAVFVICFIALSSMIPSSSIFVGPYQYAYILALNIFFVPKSEALAIALLHQAIFMLSLAFFSGIFVTTNLIQENFLAQKQEPTKETEKLSV